MKTKLTLLSMLIGATLCAQPTRTADRMGAGIERILQTRRESGEHGAFRLEHHDVHEEK